MVSLFLRSLIYNIVFYINLVIWILIGIPTFLMPRSGIITIASSGGGTATVLMRIICKPGRVSRRREDSKADRCCRAEAPVGVGDLCAAAVLRRALYILKRELRWLPFLPGISPAQMICVTVPRRPRADRMARRAREEVLRGRLLISSRKARGGRSARRPTTNTASARSMSNAA